MISIRNHSISLLMLHFLEEVYGILVFRSPALKRNIFYREITQENPTAYREARKELENKGFTINSIALDGKKGIREVFSDIPMQIASFTKWLS